MSINVDGPGDPSTSGGGDTHGDTAPPDGPEATHDDGSHASHAAARLLELTARETEQWRSDARNDAATIVARAREEAAELVRAARTEADRLASSARAESTHMTNEAREEASRLREETTALRGRHEEEVARLQQAATELRGRLRHQLTEMLDQVDSIPGASGQ
ncbi:hypothetical protein JCM18899A_21380 [Nocardioides sp. AN3]